ncbi:MAG: hypothetical protein AAF499_03015 [Pseudomonadota bacterium]
MVTSSATAPPVLQFSQAWRHEALGEGDSGAVLLHDVVTDRRVRISASALRVATLFADARSVPDAAEQLASLEVPPTQARFRELIEQLIAVGVLEAAGHDSARRATDADARARTHSLRRLLNPFAIRWDLGDPTPALRRLRAVLGILYGPVAAALAVLLILALPFQLWQHNAAFGHYLSEVLSPLQLIVAMVLVWPIMKLIHELSHAAVLYRKGGRVNRYGITFLFFMPVPFVDATDAWRLARRRDRIAVSAAGVVAELAIASLCVWLWPHTADGALKAVLSAVIVVACAASVLVNANPLMKFDGYHIVQDLLGTTQLQAQSTQTLRTALWRLLGASAAQARMPSRWVTYLLYGVAALVFKLFIVITIMLWFVDDFPLIGTALACWLIFSAFVMPSVSFIRTTASRRAQLFPSAARRVAALATVTAFGVFVSAVPLPHYQSVAGISAATNAGQLVSQAHGELEILVEDGSVVRAGQTVARQHSATDRNALTRQRLLLARLEQEKHSVRYHPSRHERAAFQAMVPKIDAARAELARLQKQIDALDVRAESDGVISFDPLLGTDGTWLQKGSLIGQVVSDDTVIARLMVHQDVAKEVLDGLRAVRVWMAGETNGSADAIVESVSPVAVSKGFDAAFTRVAGGDIATNVHNESVEDGAAYVEMQLRLADRTNVGSLLGQRVVARFELAPSTVAQRVMTSLLHTFFQHS